MKHENSVKTACTPPTSPRKSRPLALGRELRADPLEPSGPLPRSLMNLYLNTFYWYWTDLCSPPDDEFQAWLETVRYHEGGSVCDQ